MIRSFTCQDTERLANDERTGAFARRAERINDQFRLCFRWIEGDASDVEIADYHD